jgi:hypothetical protein
MLGLHFQPIQSSGTEQELLEAGFILSCLPDFRFIVSPAF